MPSLLKARRQQTILDIARVDKQVTVTELSKRFAVSEITIRRDLRELRDAGVLQRTHGGAVVPTSVPPELPVLQRSSQERIYKEAIGRAAAALVQDGDSIFIGSGTTAQCLVPYLADRRDLTVITNALNIATDLASATGITLVVTGGVLRVSELSLVGHLTSKSLQELRVDKVIVGMRTVSLEAGLTNDYLMEVVTDRAIIEMSPELIVLADHTKFGRVASAYIAPVERVAVLVTDWMTDDNTVERMRQMGIRVIVAEAQSVAAT